MSQGRTLLRGVKLPLAGISSVEEEQAALAARAARAVNLPPGAVQQIEIVKRSLDARDKRNPAFVYTLSAEVMGRHRGPAAPHPAALHVPYVGDVSPRPCVIGAGPAGLFGALLLARAGMRPLIIEQGQEVSRREQDVRRFWSGGKIDPLSNIQYGEGGAGAFSDGKLTSRGKDELGCEVLRQLISSGAAPEIAWQQKPHLGSDALPGIIARLRAEIISLGGEICYQTALADLLISKGRLRGLTLTNATGARQEMESSAVILAVGNSARPLYRMLAERGIALKVKPFAVGFRIDHDQTMLDQAQYGDFAGHPLLGAADYHLTYQAGDGRGCYTFCNCPGGHIVNASSEEGYLTVNGVSLAARDSGRGNSAVVVQVFPGRDFGCDALDGLEYQYKLEQAAYALGGEDFSLPVMPVAVFCGRAADSGIEAGFAPLAHNWRETDLSSLFSEEITAALKQALAHWQRLISGFGISGVLAAVESRTSAPLTILRNDRRESINCAGLFPAGEGAGYAGGIVSSAVDGMRSALALIAQTGSR